MNCQCGKPASYDDECRDCYENRIRREVRDFYDHNASVRSRMMMHKERCRVRMHKNYEGKQGEDMG